MDQDAILVLQKLINLTPEWPLIQKLFKSFEKSEQKPELGFMTVILKEMIVQNKKSAKLPKYFFNAQRKLTSNPKLTPSLFFSFDSSPGIMFHDL